MPIGQGQGVGLSPRNLGDFGGSANVTLLQSQIPSHTHTPQAATGGGVDTPAGNVWGESKMGKTPLSQYAASGANNVAMNPNALNNTGNSVPHNNLPPYLCVNFIIALQGVFPPRS
jgi:microcystin-dependent protein